MAFGRELEPPKYINLETLKTWLYSLFQFVNGRGSCTLTLTGCTTAPTGTAYFSRAGKNVFLVVPTISATSNSTAATLTGLDPSLYPSRSQVCLMRVIDSGTTQIGVATVGTNGTITLNLGVAAGAFAAAGTKGVSATTIGFSLE